MDNSNRVDRVIKEIESGHSLPVLSPVALKLVELAAEEDVTVQQLIQLIEKDPALSARLLRLANSALFYAPIPVASLNQAVMRIGFERLRLMALTLSLKDAFPLGKVGALDYEEFWKVSLFRAIISRTLANYVENVEPGEAFIAALLMEIGFLIFYDLFLKGKTELPKLQIEPLEELLEWETKNFGIDHRQIGAAALKHWRFPGEIIECQRAGLETISPDSDKTMVKICNVARMGSRLLYEGSSNFYSIFQVAKQNLGINHREMNDILLETFNDVEEMAHALNVEMDKEKDLLELISKANDALIQISLSLKNASFPGSDRLPSLASLDKHNPLVGYTLQALFHEIRNPLVAVGGFAKRLAKTLDPNSESGRYVNLILAEAGRLENLLAQLSPDLNQANA